MLEIYLLMQKLLSQTDGNRLALNADGLYVTNTIDCGTF